VCEKDIVGGHNLLASLPQKILLAFDTIVLALRIMHYYENGKTKFISNLASPFLYSLYNILIVKLWLIWRKILK
jgi:hypothetical protein